MNERIGETAGRRDVEALQGYDLSVQALVDDEAALRRVMGEETYESGDAGIAFPLDEASRRYLQGDAAEAGVDAQGPSGPSVADHTLTDEEVDHAFGLPSAAEPHLVSEGTALGEELAEAVGHVHAPPPPTKQEAVDPARQAALAGAVHDAFARLETLSGDRPTDNRNRRDVHSEPTPARVEQSDLLEALPDVEPGASGTPELLEHEADSGVHSVAQGSQKSGSSPAGTSALTAAEYGGSGIDLGSPSPFSPIRPPGHFEGTHEQLQAIFQGAQQEEEGAQADKESHDDIVGNHPVDPNDVEGTGELLDPFGTPTTETAQVNASAIRPVKASAHCQAAPSAADELTDEELGDTNIGDPVDVMPEHHDGYQSETDATSSRGATVEADQWHPEVDDHASFDPEIAEESTGAETDDLRESSDPYTDEGADETNASASASASTAPQTAHAASEPRNNTPMIIGLVVAAAMGLAGIKYWQKQQAGSSHNKAVASMPLVRHGLESPATTEGKQLNRLLDEQPPAAPISTVPADVKSSTAGESAGPATQSLPPPAIADAPVAAGTLASLEKRLAVLEAERTTLEKENEQLKQHAASSGNSQPPKGSHPSPGEGAAPAPASAPRKAAAAVSHPKHAGEGKAPGADTKSAAAHPLSVKVEYLGTFRDGEQLVAEVLVDGELTRVKRGDTLPGGARVESVDDMSVTIAGKVYAP